MTENLTERYEGVRAIGGADPDEVGVGRPAGMGLLKRHFAALPDDLDGNEKVGLTSAGYAVYRNLGNGRLGYFLIVLRGPEGIPSRGRCSYRPIGPKARIFVPRRPHDGFGDRWFITPEQDSRPSLQDQIDKQYAEM